MLAEYGSENKIFCQRQAVVTRKFAAACFKREYLVRLTELGHEITQQHDLQSTPDIDVPCDIHDVELVTRQQAADLDL